MTPDVGAQWLAYVARRPVVDIVSMFDDDQLVSLGKWLSKNKLLNPPRPTRKKWGVFVCKCGCGESFKAQYTTKKPQFMNEAHRQRYWRAKYRRNGA